MNLAGKSSIKSLALKLGLFDRSSTTSNFNVTQFSSPPLSGSFYITCIQPDGTSNKTAAILTNAAIYTIKSSIEDTCKYFRDKLILWDGPAYNINYLDGRDIFIRFASYNADPGQFVISQPNLSGITGGNSSVPITFSS